MYMFRRIRNNPALKHLGPGLITGAADDDPSGIATYSQAGAQFGFNMLWTIVLTFPLMVGIQMVSARMGRITGKGLAANIRGVFPRPMLMSIVALLAVANTINIAADIAAMGGALELIVGGDQGLHAVVFGFICLVLQIFMPYQRYVRFLKWLTLALLAYVAVAFTVKIPWTEVAIATFLPRFELNADAITLIVAVFGTTISPYLFFWQATQEAQDVRSDPEAKALLEDPAQAKAHLRRIKWDTYIGMGFSNLIAFFIMLSTAVTLHGAGITQIQSAAQAAEALRPIAGELTFVLFALGIIGTGMLAVPVLAGSAAYAIAETFDWKTGLDRKLFEAKEFYAIVTLATAGGVLLDFAPIDPIKALFWSAVINGFIAVPIMAVTMLLAQRRDVMGQFVVRPRLRLLGWTATGVMALAVLAMIATSRDISAML
jgi:NRAMP (natural resistance-associated macrophage protein)-like metal ion transporter